MIQKTNKITAFFLLVSTILLLYFFWKHSQNTSQNIIDSFSEKYDVCIAKDTDKEVGRCLKNLTRDAYTNTPLTEIKQVLESKLSKEHSRWCHHTMHYLGAELYRETPSLSDAFSNAIDDCDSGMFHGIIETFIFEHGQNEDIYTLMKNVCEDAMKDRSRYSKGHISLCHHGVGHGLMLVSQNDFSDALSKCQGMHTDTYPECFNGVYMELNNSHGENPRTLTVEFCDELNTSLRPYCYNRYGNQSLGDATDKLSMETICQRVPLRYVEECLTGTAEAIKIAQGPSDAAQTCHYLEDNKNLQDNCIMYAVSFFGRIDRGSSKEIEEFCNYFSDEKKRLCDKKAEEVYELWSLQQI